MKDQLILIYSYLHGVWRYRWAALAIAWVVAIPGWIAVSMLPDQYLSTVIMHIDTKSVIKPLLKGLAVESKIDSGLTIMSQVLFSRKNLEEVIRETDMDLNANNPVAMDKIVKNLANSITLVKRKRADIYELSYQGSSADHAYKVVSKLLNTVIETTLSSARTDTQIAQKFLDGQIGAYEKRLVNAEQRLAEFKRANLGVMPDATGGYYTRLQREQSTLSDLRSKLRLAKRMHSEMRKQLKGESPLLGAGDYDTQRVIKLRRYHEQLEELLTHFTEQHPDVQALRSTIADVMAGKNKGKDDYIDIGGGDSIEYNPVYQELKVDTHKASVEVETLKVRILQKESIVNKLKESIDVIPEVEAKLAKLNRDYELTRNRHISLVERRESARMGQEVGKSGSNIEFRIIDPPRVPNQPSGPNRMLLISGVFFAALVVGLGWGFLRYLIQPTFISSSQIRDKVGLPMLGTVGLFVTAKHKRKRRIQLASFLVVFSLFVASYGVLVVLKEPASYMIRSLVSSHGPTV